LLNANQQSALTTHGNIAVVAGPGSGKTRVIIAKIGKLLHDNPSNRICAVTFTRDAADELPVRLEREFPGQKLLSFSKFGTFHSLAIQQMRDAGLLGQLATPQNQSAFINQAARSASTINDPINYETATARIEAAKCSLIRDETAMADPVVANYQKLLARNRMSDLFDVIRDAVIGMRDGTVQPMSIGRTFCTHLLVDEFQDSDEVQYAWIMEHLNRGVITMVVGDDDQTIFEWRRALGHKGMLAFIEEAKATEIILGDNYRCHSEILGHADTLIRLNVGNRIEKRLIADKGPGGTVKIIKGTELEDQAYELAVQIEPSLIPCTDPSRRFEFTVKEGAWSIIARNHIILNSIESILIEKKIKYQRAGGGFWKQYFLVVFLELLKSVQMGHSSGIDLALSFAGASSHAIDQLHQHSGNKFSKFLDGKLETIPELSKDDQATFTKFSNLSSAWRNQLRDGDYDLVIRGVGSYLKEEALYKAADKERRKSLNKAQDILISYGAWTIKSPNGNRAPSLAERVEIVLKPRKKESDGVALHTMHSCKGLEFDCVGILDVSNGVIPNPERPDDINDRRLLYVSMTRAKKHLWISYKVGAASRFITESGINLANDFQTL
jgi:DNA helicase-2/ATP-dependent DNA helicase PcrA